MDNAWDPHSQYRTSTVHVSKMSSQCNGRPRSQETKSWRDFKETPNEREGGVFARSAPGYR